MARGIGFVVRHAERLDAGLDRLRRAFVRDLGREAQIQLFVTPSGTFGFGWHYDLEHVFIAQTAGVKDYYLRRNSVTPASQEVCDFSGFALERSPLATARLIAGDWLYVPGRWWHAAKCVEASLSISVGIRP
jgi:ribosomal protein L16 Arg81 hydroxylase